MKPQANRVTIASYHTSDWYWCMSLLINTISSKILQISLKHSKNRSRDILTMLNNRRQQLFVILNIIMIVCKALYDQDYKYLTLDNIQTFFPSISFNLFHHAYLVTGSFSCDCHLCFMWVLQYRIHWYHAWCIRSHGTHQKK